MHAIAGWQWWTRGARPYVWGIALLAATVVRSLFYVYIHGIGSFPIQFATPAVPVLGMVHFRWSGRATDGVILWSRDGLLSRSRVVQLNEVQSVATTTVNREDRLVLYAGSDLVVRGVQVPLQAWRSPFGRLLADGLMAGSSSIKWGGNSRDVVEQASRA